MDRYRTFTSGDYYDEDIMLAFRSALVNSGYFSQVDVSIQRPESSDDYTIPVQVVLTPRKRNLYTASIGYGTDTGLRGGLGWERRYLNRYGHSLRANLELSEIKQSAQGHYFIPLGTDENNYLNVKAGYLREDNDIFDTELLVLGLSKHHIRDLFTFRLQEAVGIEYRYEKYQIGEDTGQAKLLMPNIAWSLVRADDRIYTTNGYKITLGLRGAINKLGSDNSFLQTSISGKYIRQLFGGRIIARGELGYTSMSLLNGEFRNLPPSIRYFAGGDNSVRGYDYNSLGPTDSKNYVIGGSNLMVASIEYEHTIIGDWGAAVFYDVGNAFNEYDEPLEHGFGVGLRWRSPIGLVRVDVATALYGDKYPLRLHINIGPDL
jgi:translocation and assembly module TamA